MMKILLNRIAGVGAFLSAALIPTAFLLSTLFPNATTAQRNQLEGTSEYFLILAPALLLPAVFVLGRFFRAQRPRLANAATVVGLAGMLPFLALMLLGAGLDFANQYATVSIAGFAGALWLKHVTFGFMLLIGVWLILTGVLAQLTQRVPPLLGLAALTSGVAWGALMATTLYVAFPAGTLASLTLAISLPVWLLAHLTFTIWLGFWLLTRKPADEVEVLLGA
ncbi:MAG: hypothetical protein JXB38_22965 [Anaerolineales bacterium]|nr:hypothetical protein [Anaerolineales bacterium]